LEVTNTHTKTHTHTHTPTLTRTRSPMLRRMFYRRKRGMAI